MVCRVELERSILQSWNTNFTSNTKKYKKTAKIHSKCGILTDSTAKKRNMEGFFMAEAKFKRPGTGERYYIVQILLRKTLPTDIHLQKYGRSFCLGTF